MSLKKVNILLFSIFSINYVLADDLSSVIGEAQNQSLTTINQNVSPNAQADALSAANSVNQINQNGVPDSPMIAPTTANSHVQMQDASQAVPQIANNQNLDPVNSGKVLVNQNQPDASKMVMTSDVLTQDLNNVKKQQELQRQKEQAAKMSNNNYSNGSGSYVPSISQGNNQPSEEVKPITANMIGYLIIKGKTSQATIQFADGSTLDVRKGDLVAGYKVSTITPDKINLYKYDKAVEGPKTIVVRKSNPTFGQQGAVSFGDSQSFSMDKPAKQY